jgi:hypothetical protein
MDSPYVSPRQVSSNRCVTIADRSRFVMPAVCAACGSAGAQPIHYTQDHIPIVLPGMGFVRTTQVAIPYCDSHAHEFQARFSRLRLAQGIAYALALAFGCLVIFPPDLRGLLLLAPQPSWIEYALTAIVFLFLVATIFLVKPFMYDVFIAISGNQLRMKGGCPGFMDSVVVANQGNVSVS